jgi:aminoglycoside phosphotransferase family enzyme
MTDEQIPFLQQALASLYHEPEVTLVETHISWVFLTSQYAYKLKKPVDFGFINCATLERRKFLCEQEVILNNRLSEGVYLEVVSIFPKEGGGFTWERGQGEAIDYAVKMRRLDTSREMDRLLEKGEVRKEHMEQIAQQLANFHAFTDTVRTEDPTGEISTEFIDLHRIRPHILDLFGEQAAALLDHSMDLSKEILARTGDRLRERMEEGFLIDGHGDLHSGNIFLLDQPVIFDCIEFNDRLRQIDVLNEIAFLCMDLDFYKRPDLEGHFLNAYLKAYPCIFSDTDWLLFRFFKWYRANVRLKVNALRLDDPALTETEEAEVKGKVEEYWMLYKRYASVIGEE